MNDELLSHAIEMRDVLRGIVDWHKRAVASGSDYGIPVGRAQEAESILKLFDRALGER